MRSWFALLLCLSVGACATYREDLNRGERLYDNNEYDRALSIWRYLEADMDSLDWKDQARYAYLRGMTDYRLNFRPDARHWLALAKAIDVRCAPLTPLGQTSMMTITRPVMVQMIRVSIKVPSMAIIPC